MSETITAKTPAKRRRFSKTFKAKIVAASKMSGTGQWNKCQPDAPLASCGQTQGWREFYSC